MRGLNRQDRHGGQQKDVGEVTVYNLTKTRKISTEGCRVCWATWEKTLIRKIVKANQSKQERQFKDPATNSQQQFHKQNVKQGNAATTKNDNNRNTSDEKHQ